MPLNRMNGHHAVNPQVAHQNALPIVPFIPPIPPLILLNNEDAAARRPQHHFLERQNAVREEANAGEHDGGAQGADRPNGPRLA